MLKFTNSSFDSSAILGGCDGSSDNNGCQAAGPGGKGGQRPLGPIGPPPDNNGGGNNTQINNCSNTNNGGSNGAP